MRFFVLCCCLTLSILVFAQNSLQTVNSPFDEQNAVLSPDGRTLYLTIAHHPQNVGGKRDPGDIWISTWSNGQWSAPTHGGTVINDRGYNGVAGFNADGSQMFLLSHYAAKTQGISVTRATGSGWSRPENISIPYFQNKSDMVSGYLSSDGKVFVFSAETYGSYGVEDIYVSLKDETGRWSPPRNLGSGINTQFQELCPSLSDDAMTLYFSTNGRGGEGSFDVFKATRLDDSWTNWSTPVNLGPQVNTSGRELYYRFYESNGTAFFTSTLNSDGYGDVRMLAPGDYTPPEQTPIVQEQEERVEEPVATSSDAVRVFGIVTDTRTGEAIPATLTFTGEAGERAITSNGNGYEFLATEPASYRVVITAPGFISTMEKLDVTDLSQRSLEMNFSMQPVERGTTVNLKSVLFEQSKTDLLPESYAELDVVVEFLKNNPTVAIELAGHTDNRGVPSANVELSRARVEKVKAYLVSKGISEKRITGKGYGGSRPIASNDNEETRKLNRRVEFTIKRF